MRANMFRLGLAVVTLGGAAYLDSAHAAVPPSQDECEDFARIYATSYCTDKGGEPSSVEYTCHPDGTATIHFVGCISPD